MCQRSGIQKYLEFAAAAVTAPRDVIMKKQNLTRISFYCVSVLDSRFWGYLEKVGVFGFAFW